MKIKSKVAWGVVALFLSIVGMGIIGLYYIHTLATETRAILKNNYETLQHMGALLAASDSLDSRPDARNQMRVSFAKQQANITEPGERELTEKLGLTLNVLVATGAQDSLLRTLRSQVAAIQGLNMRAIQAKSERADKTAQQAVNYLVMVATAIGIVTFTLILNFPGYIANPIVQLTTSIQAIARKNYEERLHFSRHDEFAELAQAFNQMAEKLDEYEHSNLAQVLFEKTRIETIINRMNDPVIGLDEYRNIVFTNAQALHLMNLSAEHVIGRYAPDVAVENDLLRKLIQADEPGRDRDLIKVVLNGKENFFSKEVIGIQVTPTGEPEPKSIGQVILLKNVTPFKELDLARTNFIATISHELKTPIAALQTCAQLLNDPRLGPLTQQQTTIVGTLSEESQRLSKLVTELLDLSQVETGNLRLNLSPVKSGKLIARALEATHVAMERRGIRVQTQWPNEEPTLNVDVEKTTWALTNLLTNAVKYSPEGGTIEIAVQVEGGKTLISVRDHGSGIEAKYLPRIFDKFFQVPGAPQGTGLGLAISKEFIEAQQGTLTVLSQPGQGSVFTITLPGMT